MRVHGGDFVRQLPDANRDLARPTAIAQRLHVDVPLLALLSFVSAFGLLVLFSANGQQNGPWMRQLWMFAAAFVAMFVVAQIDVQTYRRLAPWLYLAGLVFLLAVTFFGSGAKGAQRWLEIPGLPRFQPSELSKILVPMMIAWLLAGHGLPPSLPRVLSCLVVIVVPTSLVLIQPDLGTAILVACSGFIALFLAGLSWTLIFVVLGLSALSAPLIWIYVLENYQRLRILTLLEPGRDRLGAGWNIIQSKTAIGSGGVRGKGWLEGTQSQLDFLPERHTDFIIAVLAEEFGLYGVALLLSLYVLLVGRCLFIALQAQDTFSRLVAGSITLTFFVYIFVNMGMVSGLLPVVGIPLPLVSYGGTSLITLMMGFGVLMAISTEQRRLIN